MHTVWSPAQRIWIKLNRFSCKCANPLVIREDGAKEVGGGGSPEHAESKGKIPSEKKKKKLSQKGKKKKIRSGLDYLDRAVSWCLFTSAIPLLPGTGPFVCCISALDLFEPHYATWACAASADTSMLMRICLT